MKVRVALVALAGLIAAGGPVFAASQQDWADCQNENPDVAIAACTKIINNPGETNENLAIAYNNRGVGYKNKGKNDAAIANYMVALKFNPQYENAYYNRGNAWYAEANYDQAIADYNQALIINPKDAEAYNNRGLSWYHENKYDQAIADFNLSHSDRPDLFQGLQQSRPRLLRREKIRSGDCRLFRCHQAQSEICDRLQQSRSRL